MLVDAFGLGMLDAAAYSIIGSLLNLRIHGGAAGIRRITPQGKANARARKVLAENLGKLSSNIQDIQKLSQEIQQGNINVDDIVADDPIVFLPRSKIDENTALALGIQQELLEDENGDIVQDDSQDTSILEDIDNTSTALLQDFEDLTADSDSVEETADDEEVAVRKSDWDRFAAENPQEAQQLQDYIREGTKGITANEQIARKWAEIENTINENPELKTGVDTLSQKFIQAGKNPQEALALAILSGYVSDNINKRYGIPLQQGLNIDVKRGGNTSTTVDTEIHNQTDRRSNARKFLDLINEGLKIATSDENNPFYTVDAFKEQAKQLGISEQNIEAVLRRMHEENLVKSVFRPKDMSSWYYINAQEAMNFFDSAGHVQEDVIKYLQRELDEIIQTRPDSERYQGLNSVKFNNEEFTALDINAEFREPDNSNLAFRDAARKINSLNFYWDDLRKNILGQFSAKQLHQLSEQMGFNTSAYKTKKQIIERFVCEIQLRRQSRRVLGTLNTPSTKLRNSIDILETRISFLHKLLEDDMDELFPSAPPPPPDYTAGSIAQFTAGKDNQGYSVFVFELPDSQQFAKRYSGTMFEIRDSSDGKIIARYSPFIDIFETRDKPSRATKQIEKAFRKELPTILQAAGLLDENGQLKPDGNEEFRKTAKRLEHEDKETFRRRLNQWLEEEKKRNSENTSIQGKDLDQQQDFIDSRQDAENTADTDTELEQQETTPALDEQAVEKAYNATVLKIAAMLEAGQNDMPSLWDFHKSLGVGRDVLQEVYNRLEEKGFFRGINDDVPIFTIPLRDEFLDEVKRIAALTSRAEEKQAQPEQQKNDDYPKFTVGKQYHFRDHTYTVIARNKDIVTLQDENGNIKDKVISNTIFGEDGEVINILDDRESPIYKGRNTGRRMFASGKIIDRPASFFAQDEKQNLELQDTSHQSDIQQFSYFEPEFDEQPLNDNSEYNTAILDDVPEDRIQADIILVHALRGLQDRPL